MVSHERDSEWWEKLDTATWYYQHALAAATLSIMVQNTVYYLWEACTLHFMWYIFDAINTVLRSLFVCSNVHHRVK